MVGYNKGCGHLNTTVNLKTFVPLYFRFDMLNYFSHIEHERSQFVQNFQEENVWELLKNGDLLFSIDGFGKIII